MVINIIITIYRTTKQQNNDEINENRKTIKKESSSQIRGVATRRCHKSDILPQLCRFVAATRYRAEIQ